METAVQEPDDFDVTMTEPPDLPPAEEVANSCPTPDVDEHVEEGEVVKGDTLASILDDDLSLQEIQAVIAALQNVFSMSSFRLGQPYSIHTVGDCFQRFEYQISSEEMLLVERQGEGFSARRERIHYDIATEALSGVITDNLFAAVEALGESPALAIRLADLFAYDVDFMRGLRQGDSFRVLLEKRSREGQPAGYGRVLAATFTNDGKTHSAFLFAGEDEKPQYYDESGRSLRKAFLKAPLRFNRISSGFSMSRLHPITGKRKAHPAIDYAAPSGTPVHAVGDATVMSAGWHGGAGRMISLRHGNGYETLYMHLRGFAKGVSPGAKVSQGQTIGYVGSTGMSTGPHLDFRMRCNGQWLNPQKTITPPARNIEGRRLAEFKHLVGELSGRLQAAVARAADKTSAKADKEKM